MMPVDNDTALAELDARIAADRTGLLSLRLAAERAALLETTANRTPNLLLFANFGEIVEAAL